MGVDAPMCPVDGCKEYAHMPLKVYGPNGVIVDLLVCTPHWLEYGQLDLAGKSDAGR